MADRTDVLFLAFSESYAAAGLVAVKSALGHAPVGTSVVIGHVDLSRSTIRRLESVAASRGATLDVRPVAALLADFPAVGRYPPITWTRTLVSDIFKPSVKRVIYLDADVLVRAPLDPLFDVDLGEAPLAAVADSEHPSHESRGVDYVSWAGTDPTRRYFNSGVMVIEVGRWAQANVPERVREVIRRDPLPLDYVDQDALNVIFDRQWVELDRSWNVPARQATRSARIVQFIGEEKPWDEGASGPFVEEFAQIAATT